ncbi:MAG: PAS domain S-box protein, partial [Phycisphaerales bacterium]
MINKTYNREPGENDQELVNEMEPANIQPQSETKEYSDIIEEIRSNSSILDKSTDALIIMNLQGQILHANDSAYRFLELNSGYGINIANRPFSELFREIMANKNHFFEIRVNGKNGAYIDLEINSHVDCFNGQPVIVSILRDVSERKKTEQTLLYNQTIVKALLNAAPESAFLFDCQGYLLTLNEIAALRMGLTPEQWTNRHISQLFPREVSLHRMERIQEVVNTKKTVTFQDIRNDLYFENTIAPILNPDGGVYMVAMFAHEITEYKLAQA